MKVKFSHQFMNHENKPMLMSGNQDDFATLKKVSIDVLMHPMQKEMDGMSASEKCKRHDLAVKILNFGDEAELVSEDVTLLKKLIGERYIPTIVAQSFAILDAKEMPVYNISEGK